MVQVPLQPSKCTILRCVCVFFLIYESLFQASGGTWLPWIQSPTGHVGARRAHREGTTNSDYRAFCNAGWATSSDDLGRTLLKIAGGLVLFFRLFRFLFLFLFVEGWDSFLHSDWEGLWNFTLKKGEIPSARTSWRFQNMWSLPSPQKIWSNLTSAYFFK